MREYTNKLYDMLNEKIVAPEFVILACLKYMSEDDVEDMMRANDLITD